MKNAPCSVWTGQIQYECRITVGVEHVSIVDRGTVQQIIEGKTPFDPYYISSAFKLVIKVT